MKPNKRASGWTQHVPLEVTQLDKVLIDLINEKQKNWSAIASKLRRFHNFKRTGRQCRERWYNHLDPAINKQQWTSQQEDILFQQYMLHGSKWCKISPLLPKRSQNCIKNHFYSMIRKFLRRINKLVGQKNGTQKVKIIKPLTLCKFFRVVQQNLIENEDEIYRKQQQKRKQQIYKLINFSRRKLSQSSSEIQKADFQKFSNLIQELTKINATYQVQKSEQARIKRQKKLQTCFDRIVESSSDQSQSSESQSQRIYEQKKQKLKKMYQKLKQNQNINNSINFYKQNGYNFLAKPNLQIKCQEYPMKMLSFNQNIHQLQLNQNYWQNLLLNGMPLYVKQEQNAQLIKQQYFGNMIKLEDIGTQNQMKMLIKYKKQILNTPIKEELTKYEQQNEKIIKYQLNKQQIQPNQD